MKFRGWRTTGRGKHVNWVGAALPRLDSPLSRMIRSQGFPAFMRKLFLSRLLCALSTGGSFHSSTYGVQKLASLPREATVASYACARAAFSSFLMNHSRTNEACCRTRRYVAYECMLEAAGQPVAAGSLWQTPDSRT